MKTSPLAVARSLSARPFFRFLAWGGFVGVLSTFCMYVIESLWAQTAFRYQIATAAIYSGAAVVSYVGHLRFTFRKRHRGGHTEFIRHCVVTFTLAIMLSFVAEFGRRVLLPILGTQFSGTLAFVLAACLSAFMSYWLSRVWVFRVQIESTKL